MMTRFIARLWPLLEAEPTLRAFLFQSVFFTPEPDGSHPFLLKLIARPAAYFTGATEMLKDNTAVMQFMADNRKAAFGTVVTRPGKIVDTRGGIDLTASKTPRFAAITFADLGALTVGAVQDASFHGTYPSETPALARDVVRIDAPVQVLHGEFDTFVSVTNSQRLADLLPNSRFAIIPGAAHYAWEDNAPDYLSRVLSFIEEVEATAKPPP